MTLAKTVQTLKNKKKYNLIDFIFPDKGDFCRDNYAKHIAFIQAGAKHRFRVLSGGNGSGKSFTGAVELTYHLTGNYPSWYKGHKFKKAITCWIVAESGALYRDSLQAVLVGAKGEEHGTGLIPKENIKELKSLPGVPGALGQLHVKHKSGGVSSVVVKTFEMGREQFQAATLDLILFDEEPPEQIYSECVMRLRGVKGRKDPGIAMLLFTPLKGISNVVMRFLPNGQFPPGGIHPEHPNRFVIAIEWNDAPHLTEEDKKAMLEEIPPNERDARSKGIPSIGSGRIYPLSEEDVCVAPFKIPDYYARAYGLDFGWNNTAALWAAQDPTTNVIYLYAEYKRGKLADYQHVHAIQQKGDWMVGAADPSGGGRRDDGRMRIDHYRSLGLNLQPGFNAIVPGIGQVYTMLDTGALKVFSNMEKFLSEFRVYRYDVKDPNKVARNQDDHLLDCLRYLVSQFDMICVSKYDMEMEDVDPYDEYQSNHDVDPLTGY